MILHVHTLKPARGAKRKKKLIGRGNASGHGTYSTRGGKGQTARSGGSRGLRLKAFKPLMQQTPKLRGFHSQKVKPTEVYLRDLNSNFAEGEIVSLASLKEKKLVSVNSKAVKIISTGGMSKKVTVEGVALSKGAEEKIKKAGGEVK